MSVVVCVPLFNRTNRCPEKYRQVVAYHYGMARHHLLKAQLYCDHAKARYGVQLPLFDADDGERDGDPEASCHDRVHRPADT